MADVVPFPLVRRVDLVRRQANHARSMKPEAAERAVRRAVDQQRQTLINKGVGRQIVDRECVQFEAAIRAAIWQLSSRGASA